MKSKETYISEYQESDVEYDGSSDYDTESFYDSSFESESCDDASCSKQVEETNYKVLSTKDILFRMRKDIEEVTTVTSLQEVTARVLLDFFHWDTLYLTDRFFADGCDELCKKAGILNLEKYQIAKTISEKPASEFLECNLCHMEYKNFEMKHVDCSHLFCNTCWTIYLQSVINQAGESIKITCPAYNCDFLVDDKIVIEALGESDDKWKYQQLLIQSYVNCNLSLRWCPYPDCSYAVKMGKVRVKHVTCKCSNQFCFQCAEGWHDPVPCNLLKRWKSKWNYESETANWILENIKDCPKCHASIPKIYGRNCIICSKCSFQFCLLCLGPAGRYHICNLYKEEERTNSKSKENSLDLDARYKFFCSRYVSHSQSQKLEKLWFAVENIKPLKHYHIDAMQKGLEILCSCRQTLQLTYIFACYLKRNNQSIIFDENQTKFEESIEALSKCLKRNLEYYWPFNSHDVHEKAFYCEQRRKNLLEHVQEGNDKNWWTYFEGN